MFFTLTVSGSTIDVPNEIALHALAHAARRQWAELPITATKDRQTYWVNGAGHLVPESLR